SAMLGERILWRDDTGHGARAARGQGAHFDVDTAFIRAHVNVELLSGIPGTGVADRVVQSSDTISSTRCTTSSGALVWGQRRSIPVTNLRAAATLSGIPGKDVREIVTGPPPDRTVREKRSGLMGQKSRYCTFAASCAARRNEPGP